MTSVVAEVNTEEVEAATSEALMASEVAIAVEEAVWTSLNQTCLDLSPKNQVKEAREVATEEEEDSEEATVEASEVVIVEDTEAATVEDIAVVETSKEDTEEVTTWEVAEVNSEEEATSTEEGEK